MYPYVRFFTISINGSKNILDLIADKRFKVQDWNRTSLIWKGKSAIKDKKYKEDKNDKDDKIINFKETHDQSF